MLNVENPNSIEETVAVQGSVEEVSSGEVERALRRMKLGKVNGSSGLSADLLKAAGESVIPRLVVIFNEILSTSTSPEERTHSVTVPIFKGKGDPLFCSKYRVVCILEHGMKIWEKVLAVRLGVLTNIHGSQFGFMPGKSTTDAIFCLRHIQTMYRAKNKLLYHIFINLENAFDRVPISAIQWALRRQGVPELLVRAVMQLYVGWSTRVLAAGGLSDGFEIGVGVHQGSVLSPLLFNLVLEEATEECTRGAPWSMLYADDLVLTAETHPRVVDEFGRWL